MGALFLLVHVGLSVAGIFAGFVVAGGMLASARLPGWTAFFLFTTVFTSVTGFFLPAPHGFGPPHVLGVLSLVALAIALYALYGGKLKGGSRKAYVITALVALYFNSFVLVVQLFQKVPALKELAPNQTEPPFGISQTLLLAMFVVLGFAAVKRFRPVEV